MVWKEIEILLLLHAEDATDAKAAATAAVDE